MLTRLTLPGPKDAKASQANDDNDEGGDKEMKDDAKEEGDEDE